MRFLNVVIPKLPNLRSCNLHAYESTKMVAVFSYITVTRAVLFVNAVIQQALFNMNDLC